MTRNIPNEPETRGYAAYGRGKGLHDNPYREGDNPGKWRLWRDGWFEAEHDYYRKGSL